ACAIVDVPFPYTTLFRSGCFERVGVLGGRGPAGVAGRGAEACGSDTRVERLTGAGRYGYPVEFSRRRRDRRRLRLVTSSAGLLRSEEHTSELQSPCNLVC